MDSFNLREKGISLDGKPDISSILLSTSVFILFICLIKYLWERRRLYYYASKMHGPKTWPIVGNAFYFSGGTEDILENIRFLLKTYKSPLRVWLGQRLFFGIAQPKDLEVILNTSLAKERLYKFTAPITRTGIFTAPVDKWRRHRKVILPTFNQKILNTFVDIFAERSEKLVEILDQYSGKGTFDCLPVVGRCTLDIICETALGVKVNALTENCNFVKWIERGMEIIFMRMFQIWLHSDFIWRLTSLSTELDVVAGKINNFIQEIISRKKEEYRRHKVWGEEFFEDAPRRKAFLDYLIELSEEGAKWSDEEIMEEVATISVAGSDSTASTNSFTFIMLGMHQEIQEKVYGELQSILGDSQRSVAVEDLPKMVYLERVIKETMRLFPIGPVIVRALDKQVELESYTLPEGSSCVLGIIHTHRDPELWPDPLKFDPDRFLPEEVAKRHPYSYIPFSAGPRNCIGPKFALMAMKTLIATVVRNYKITTDYKKVEDIRLKADLMLKTVDGYNVAFERREP